MEELNKELEQNIIELQGYKELLKNALNEPLCIESKIEAIITGMYFLYYKNDLIQKKIIDTQLKEKARKILKLGGANV